MEKYGVLLARILLAHMFLISGTTKIFGYAGTQGYMESMGVPGAFLPLVILLEVGGGLALILGFMTRWVAAALGLFSVVSAVIFHADFSNQMQMIMFMKNLTIAGGMLMLVAHGPGELSVDRKLARNRTHRDDNHHGATPHFGAR